MTAFVRTSMVSTILSVFLLFVSPAGADVTLNYIGSFQAGTGYYARGLSYVPGSTATADRGQEVVGPTIVTLGSHGATDFLKEFTIPALVTSGPVNVATEVTPASGGTFVDNVNSFIGSAGGGDSLAVLNEQVWMIVGKDSSSVNWGVGRVLFGSNQDWSSDNGVSRLQPFGKPSGEYSSAGLATKWDEADTFVGVRWNYETQEAGVNEGYRVYVTKITQGAPDGGDANLYAWSSSVIFDFYVQDPGGTNSNPALRYRNIEYIEIDGQAYFVMSNEGATNTFVLDFYNAATATGSDVAPDFSLDLTDDITNGVGWWNNDGRIKDLAWDGVDTLYALNTEDSGGSPNGYIHAFQFQTTPVPEPATVALLAVGGVLLSASVRRRRN